MLHNVKKGFTSIGHFVTFVTVLNCPVLAFAATEIINTLAFLRFPMSGKLRIKVCTKEGHLSVGFNGLILNDDNI